MAKHEVEGELVEALNRMLVHFVGQGEEDCPTCGEPFDSETGCDTCYVLEKAREALRNAEAGREPAKDWTICGPTLGTCETTMELCIGEHDGTIPHRRWSTCGNWRPAPADSKPAGEKQG